LEKEPKKKDFLNMLDEHLFERLALHPTHNKAAFYVILLLDAAKRI